jgi:hypothetical protein
MAIEAAMHGLGDYSDSEDEDFYPPGYGDGYPGGRGGFGGGPMGGMGGMGRGRF